MNPAEHQEAARLERQILHLPASYWNSGWNYQWSSDELKLLCALITI